MEEEDVENLRLVLSSSEEDEVGSTSVNHSLTGIIVDMITEVEKAKCMLEPVDKGMASEYGRLQDYNTEKHPLTLSETEICPRLPPQELSAKIEFESQPLGGSDNHSGGTRVQDHQDRHQEQDDCQEHQHHHVYLAACDSDVFEWAAEKYVIEKGYKKFSLKCHTRRYKLN